MKGIMLKVAFSFSAAVVIGFLVSFGVSIEHDLASMNECKAQVSARLAYPASSRFEGVEKSGELVTGTVQASNAFGVLSPLEFECSPAYDDDGEIFYRLERMAPLNNKGK